MEKKVALVLSLMLLASMMLVSAEEASPTIGQRLDTATNHVTDFFHQHVGPALDTAKSVFNWFGDKAKEWGL